MAGNNPMPPPGPPNPGGPADWDDRGEHDHDPGRDDGRDGDWRRDGGTTVQVTERQRRGRGRYVPHRPWRYAQAEQRPADRPNDPAHFSTGPGEVQEYHYHRTPTYHDQYAQDQGGGHPSAGWENNPT